MKTVCIVMLLVTNAVLLTAEMQPIDVEPVGKKDQPDFEDDTGMGPAAVDITVQQQALEADGVLQLINRYTGSGRKDLSFTHAFIASLCVIIVSELGDKTFFIAAIMAMNHARVTVFSGAMAALSVMHVMSAFFGYIFAIIPRAITFYVSSALFAVFGLKMLREGCKMSPDEGKEEFEEVQTDLRRQEDNFLIQENPENLLIDYHKEPLEEGGGGYIGRFHRNRILKVVSRIFVQAFTLTFLAEWGDRSQIATVILATREDIAGVIIGGLLGHFLCTGLAVIGGRMIASRISIKTVTIVGGFVFIGFALSALFISP